MVDDLTCQGDVSAGHASVARGAYLCPRRKWHHRWLERHAYWQLAVRIVWKPGYGWKDIAINQSFLRREILEEEKKSLAYLRKKNKSGGDGLIRKKLNTRRGLDVTAAVNRYFAPLAFLLGPAAYSVTVMCCADTCSFTSSSGSFSAS